MPLTEDQENELIERILAFVSAEEQRNAGGFVHMQEAATNVGAGYGEVLALLDRMKNEQLVSTSPTAAQSVRLSAKGRNIESHGGYRRHLELQRSEENQTKAESKQALNTANTANRISGLSALAAVAAVVIPLLQSNKDVESSIPNHLKELQTEVVDLKSQISVIKQIPKDTLTSFTIKNLQTEVADLKKQINTIKKVSAKPKNRNGN